MKTVILTEDSRDAHAHMELGNIGLETILDEFDFDSGLLNVIEQPYEVCCTAISGCDVATDQTKKIYDYTDLFAFTPHGSGGATPQDSLGTMCKKGLLIKGTYDRDMQWDGYYRSDTGQYDAFDNLRASLWGGKTSTTVASWWYQEWSMTPSGAIMPIGKTVVSSHDYKISGVKLVNGQQCLIVKAWLGYVTYMPRETCNAVFAKWGCAGYIPLNKNGFTPSIRSKELGMVVTDFYKNMWIQILQWILLLKF